MLIINGVEVVVGPYIKDPRVQWGDVTYDDSNAGGTIYSDDNTIASIAIRLVSATHWQIIGANGVWTTT